jgi:pyruvate dehydrogenase E2 component (dihydrolipoamide acetyltransferase)
VQFVRGVSIDEETGMAVEIKMPRLSQTTDEVRLLNWLVQEGDTVQKGEPLCEVETDKVTMAVESFEGGTVLKLVAEPDTVVDAGEVIAVLGEEGEQVPERAASDAEGASRSRVAEEKPERAAHSAASPVRPLGDGVRATRLVRNIAQKRNIDLSRVRGTGPRGIITKRDLETFASSRGREVPERAVGEPGRAAVSEDVIPMTPHQRAVAHSLSKSAAEAPHFYLKTDILTDGIAGWREAHPRSDGRKVSVDAFFVYAVSRVLGEMPGLNAYYKKDSIVRHRGININVAIAAKDELYAPLIREVDKKSIEEIDGEVRRIARKTRENRLEPGDIAPGSFTVTNLGMFSVDEFGAVINPPQSGILSIGRMRKALVVEPDDAIRVRTLCTVTGSFDHRVVNGTQGAACIQRIKEILEEMELS